MHATVFAGGGIAEALDTSWHIPTVENDADTSSFGGGGQVAVYLVTQKEESTCYRKKVAWGSLSSTLFTDGKGTRRMTPFTMPRLLCWSGKVLSSWGTG